MGGFEEYCCIWFDKWFEKLDTKWFENILLPGLRNIVLNLFYEIGYKMVGRV